MVLAAALTEMGLRSVPIRCAGVGGSASRQFFAGGGLASPDRCPVRYIRGRRGAETHPGHLRRHGEAVGTSVADRFRPRLPMGDVHDFEDRSSQVVPYGVYVCRRRRLRQRRDHGVRWFAVRRPLLPSLARFRPVLRAASVRVRSVAALRRLLRVPFARRRSSRCSPPAARRSLPPFVVCRRLWRSCARLAGLLPSPSLSLGGYCILLA